MKDSNTNNMNTGTDWGRVQCNNVQKGHDMIHTQERCCQGAYQTGDNKGPCLESKGKRRLRSQQGGLLSRA